MISWCENFHAVGRKKFLFGLSKILRGKFYFRVPKIPYGIAAKVFCIDINHFCTNNSIFYKTSCFLTKNWETREHNLRFRWHGRPFSQRDLGAHFRYAFWDEKNELLLILVTYIKARWFGHVRAEMFSFTTQKATRDFLPLFLPMRSKIGNKHIF